MWGCAFPSWGQLAESSELFTFESVFSPFSPGRAGMEPSLVSVSPMVGDLKVVSGLEWILCSSERVAEIFVSGTFRPRGALEPSNSRACVTYAVICSNLCFV